MTSIKELKCMVNKQKLYSIALVSTALVLMLISIIYAAPFVYITNSGSNNVSVIDTATNTVIATVPVESHPSRVGSGPYGVAITPNGTKVYVTNYNDKTAHLKSDEANTNLVPIDNINSPNSSKAWNNKGSALYKLNKSDEAIKAYDKAIEINPQISETWNNKGIALYELNRSDEAMKAYDKAIEINPNNSDAWYNKGLVLYKLNKQYEAMKAYDKVIEIDPQYSKAWNDEGVVLYNLNKSYEAIKAYDKAIGINPRYSKAWNNKGLALNNLNKYDEAIKAYDKANQINPHYSDAWYNRACIYSLTNKKEQSISNFTKAVELDSAWKEIAKKDPDFKGLWTDEKFKELTK